MGDPVYDRRRIDELMDGRVASIGREVGEVKSDVRDLDAKVDALSARVTWLFGGLAVVAVIVSILGPIIASRVVGP